jgi:hypothetical protein
MAMKRDLVSGRDILDDDGEVVDLARIVARIRDQPQERVRPVIVGVPDKRLERRRWNVRHRGRSWPR